VLVPGILFGDIFLDHSICLLKTWLVATYKTYLWVRFCFCLFVCSILVLGGFNRLYYHRLSHIFVLDFTTYLYSHFLHTKNVHSTLFINYCVVQTTRILTYIYNSGVRVRVMVLNATINNISVLLVGETGVPGENHRPSASHRQLYHIKLHRVHLAWAGFEVTTLLMKGTDCIGSCKSNYHTSMTMTAPSTTLCQAL